MGKKTLASVGYIILILLAGGIFVYQQGPFAAIRVSPTPTSTPTPSGFKPPEGKVYIGVWRESGILTYDALKVFVNDIKAKTGKGVAILAIYSQFDSTSKTYQNPLHRLKGAEQLYRDGIISAYALGWNPWNPAIFADSRSDTQTITKIASGDYDSYLRDLAQGMKASLTAPLFVRFGSEMNGDWHGYGYDASIYIKAWRRVHDIFTQEGVKAIWIFQPNRQPDGQYPQMLPNRRPWKDYYPGDAYVDWIGVSWHSFSLYGRKEKTIDEWFTEGEYLEFANQHNKPFIFSETGTDGWTATEYGIPVSYQVEFIKQLFDFMNRHNEVKGFIWYDLPYTLLIPETLNAYRQGITNPRYTDERTPTFRINSLLISPTEVSRGETVRISVDIVNTGDVMITYTLTLKINGVVEATKEVTLAGGESATVTFEVARDVAGTYNVEVDGLKGAFTVRLSPRPAEFQVSDLSISPREVKAGEAVTITFKITNIGGSEGTYTVALKVDARVEATQDIRLAAGASTHVTFKATEGVVGTYHVEVNGQTGTFAMRDVAAPPPPPSPLELWLPYIGVAIVAIAILAAAALLIRRRK